MGTIASPVLKIHETTTASGMLSAVFLRFADGVLFIVSDGVSLPLPDGSIEAVMVRFGAPFDTTSEVVAIDALDLGVGDSIRHVRHLAWYDVIARDYLVYERGGREPMCALATTVTGALAYLGRASLDAGNSLRLRLD